MHLRVNGGLTTPMVHNLNGKEANSARLPSKARRSADTPDSLAQKHTSLLGFIGQKVQKTIDSQRDARRRQEATYATQIEQAGDLLTRGYFGCHYIEAYSWGVGEDESGDGLYCGFEGVVGAAVIGVQDTPGFEVRDDTLNEVADAVDGRVVSPVGVGEFTMGGFLHGGDHSQSDVALVPTMGRGIKCLEESGFLDGLRIMHTAC